ncbi:MAG: aminoacyl-tRNA hydrolase [Alphaproteobacteria bacterium]|nr:aminoacyl-tRNA hydrolase [Alphaproteobacteria bacterium]
MQENKPILIVGLGNPGTEYARTRHNVGFMAVQYLAGNDATWKSEHFAKTSAVNIDGHRIIFAMPQTFMNDSGRAVRAIMGFYKIPVENLVVIHDDMDLKTGDVRTKVGGGSAGHNGIKSIDANVGREYLRIRIGIDHPRNFGLSMDPADWVLGKFTDEQLSIIQDTIKNINYNM